MKPYSFLQSLFYFFIGSLVVLSESCSTNPTGQSADKPNVLVILTDDMGWGDLSVHGNTNLSTLNIDRIAQSGMQFTNFYVCAVCSPTRAEFLTGRYHPRSGVYHTSAGGERMDLDETTIAEIFSQAGYATAAYGKWHNGMQYPYHPNARGFDDFYGFCSGHWGNYFSPMLEHNGKIVKGEGYIVDDLTDHAMAFMEEHAEGPFFLYVPFNTPHAPMQVPDEYWERFRDRPIDMRNREPEKEDIDFTRAALAMCENIDWNVGRLLDKLSELGIDDETIVVFFNDNGPMDYRWNGGMKGNKGDTDEGGVRSPLFLRYPGMIQRGETEVVAGAIDLLPTLAELCNIEYSSKKQLDGISLKTFMLDSTAVFPDRVLFNFWNGKVSVRSQDYRLDHEGRLFHIPSDRGQERDISSSEPDILADLQEAAYWFNDSVAAELPVPDARPFTLGHPDFKYTQIPARDGKAHGNIIRSNRYPNCSFFTNWLSTDDSITWDIEVIEEGDFNVTLYYTCRDGDQGVELELVFGDCLLKHTIDEYHDPLLSGMENDRYPRRNSYVKEFKPIDMGTIRLKEGKGKLSLKANSIPGEQAIDFRLMMFERVYSDLK